MSELGKREEGRAKNMDSYQSPRKAATGLGSDRLPQELREFTPASQDSPSKNWLEIRSSVDEAGRGYLICPVVVHVPSLNPPMLKLCP